MNSKLNVFLLLLNLPFFILNLGFFIAQPNPVSVIGMLISAGAMVAIYQIDKAWS